MLFKEAPAESSGQTLDMPGPATHENDWSRAPEIYQAMRKRSPLLHDHLECVDRSPKSHKNRNVKLRYYAKQLYKFCAGNNDAGGLSTKETIFYMSRHSKVDSNAT